MKAIGAKLWFILSMFLSGAVVIGFIGATTGISTGIGLAYVLSSLGASEGGHPGTAAGSHIAPIFLPNDLLRVWFLSLTISLAAGIFQQTTQLYSKDVYDFFLLISLILVALRNSIVVALRENIDMGKMRLMSRPNTFIIFI
jgi:hypothetical protein